MTRSNAREIAVHLIYSMGYSEQSAEELLAARLEEDYYPELAAENDVYAEKPSKKQKQYICDCVKGVAARDEQLSKAVEYYSIGWKANRISRFVMAVLKLAVYEMLFVDDVPDGVAVNEAVTLTKKYEDDEVGGFVNGILGSFIRNGKSLDVPQENEEAL